jgi:predicted DNA-binding transcriptional regulator YafY
LSNPYAYTKKEIVDRLEDTTPGTFETDIKILKSLDLTVDCKRPGYTYAIIPEKEFKELDYLSPLTDADRARITNALSKLPGKDSMYLNKKLDSLYDFQKLGIRALRKPALEKIDNLMEARNKGVCVILEDYYSNSSEPRNRKVEPFFVDPDYDTLQAYDVEALGIRHFKLNRIKRVAILKDSWQYKDKHHKKETDVFRIADDDIVTVHLELNMQGRNILMDTFPKAKEAIESASDKNTFDFQSEVNAKFLGITNFILGNADNVKVISPDSLKEHLKKQARKIIDQYDFL